MSESNKTVNYKKRAMVGLTLASALTITGCLTSPYYGQTFDSRYVQVPFQFWTTDKNQDVRLECAKASAHGGPLSGQSYQLITTMTPSQEPHYDYKSGDNLIYQASKKHSIPESCWRNYSYSSGDRYITVVRITQGTHGDGQVYTFNRTGLKCLGEWAGFQGMFSWLNKGCEKRWLNTDEPIRTLFLKAKP